MPMGMTSYFSRFRACRTEAAESREISCSPLRPPNRTPTLSFFITDNVPQGAVRRLSATKNPSPQRTQRAQRYAGKAKPGGRSSDAENVASREDHRFSVPLVRRSRGRRAHFRGCLDEFIQLAGRLPLQQV